MAQREFESRFPSFIILRIPLNHLIIKVHLFHFLSVFFKYVANIRRVGRRFMSGSNEIGRRTCSNNGIHFFHNKPENKLLALKLFIRKIIIHIITSNVEDF